MERGINAEDSVMPAEMYWVPGPWLGKLAVAPRPRGGDWLNDDIAGWRQAGIDTVLSTLTPTEEQNLELTRECETAEAHGLRYLSLPISDREVPESRAAMLAVTKMLERDLSGGRSVLIHCRQGIGRSGLIAACLPIDSGLPVEEALRTLSRARGLPVPETADQRHWLYRHSQTKR